jgi:magnesium-transporting ATPase (P-type)
MKTFTWILALLAALLAATVFLFGMLSASSAPQESSVSAIAIAIATIPYVLARAVEKLIEK